MMQEFEHSPKRYPIEAESPRSGNETSPLEVESFGEEYSKDQAYFLIWHAFSDVMVHSA